MSISRRKFLKYCSASAAALGLSSMDISKLQAALESDGAPTIIWLHGSGCQGDSISFLNLFLDVDVPDANPIGHVETKDVLLDHVNLVYHSVVMSANGQSAGTMLKQAYRKGGYVLVCEGAVPTKFDGGACNIMTLDDHEYTYQELVNSCAGNAAAVICLGTCACFGGIPAAGANPTGAISVPEALSQAGVSVPLLINLPGCPTHPDWTAWTVVQLILGNPIALDVHKRPSALYVNNVHKNCPRKQGSPDHLGFATTFGQDGYCLENLGCRGPGTNADCPSRKWNKGENGGVNWCVDSNGMCLGCVEPDFPGGDFYA
ncbi:MAG: hydrogenase small subunit [Phycisphaerae bacterium]|nr:hydrogenase small subunit [Phycisphaerae bacterium]